MLWKVAATIMGLGLLAGLVWDVVDSAGGPLLSVYVAVWPGLVGVLAVGAVGVASVSLTFEPAVVGLSHQGVRFGRGRDGRISAWQELEAPRSGIFGLVLRRTSVRGVLKLNYFLSPNQVRALLSHPACPRWRLPPEVSLRLEGAEAA